jgi:hypothetical protein
MHETEERTRQTQPTRVAPAERRGILSWPIAVGVVLAAIVLVLVGGTVAMRAFSPSSRESLGVVPTVAPSAPAPAPTQLPQVAPAPEVKPSTPTQQPAAVPVATVAATPRSPTATPQSGGTGQATPSAAATLDAQTVDAVKDAYQRYWDITAQALRELDASHLGEVATNGELSALQKNIEDLRAQGRAIDTSVEHHFVVNWIQGEQAQVIDRYRDRSVYIDPSTKQPLPGEVVPATFDQAPESNVVYLLQLEQGSWKVVGYNNA